MCSKCYNIFLATFTHYEKNVDEIVGKHVILVLHTQNFCVRTWNAFFVEENVVSE
jgi:hypothetical protein